MTEPERPSLLVLIRHAESARNKAKKDAVYFADDEARKTVVGIPDHEIGLTTLGERQAEETGVGLRSRFGAPDFMYHSGYRRTEETTEGILAAYPDEERRAIRVLANLFIRERDPGHAYDMTAEEAEAAFPWLQSYWKTFGGFFARPRGGESLAQVVERVYLFMQMLFRDRAGKRIFVVTHGGTLRCFRYLLERWTYDQALHWAPGEYPENCGVIVYEYNDEERHLLLREHSTVFWKPHAEKS